MGDARRTETPMVNVDRTLELIVEVLAVRLARIRAEFRKLFREGDDNGDGVLSYAEFHALVKKTAPHFSDRRVIRMFREALTSGKDSSFDIAPGTFAAICKAHGLVDLIHGRDQKPVSRPGSGSW